MNNTHHSFDTDGMLGKDLELSWLSIFLTDQEYPQKSKIMGNHLGLTHPAAIAV